MANDWNGLLSSVTDSALYRGDPVSLITVRFTPRPPRRMRDEILSS